MAHKYLLDTSVYSQPIRPIPNANCQLRWKKLTDSQLAVPAMGIAELEFGLFLKDSDRLWAAYRSILKDRLKIFDFDANAASVFGELKAKQTQSGKTVDDFDLAIAAVAIAHDLTVATLDPRHFKLIDGLHWEDWSSAA
jgi:predicted nucleic acid-binding protein